jgi:hypothetical protein
MGCGAGAPPIRLATQALPESSYNFAVKIADNGTNARAMRNIFAEGLKYS